MRKFFTVVARLLAATFAILFVLTAIPALLLSTFERNIFKADLYKQAFVEQHIYNDLPGILGEMLTTSVSFNPCEQNPVTCEDIPPEATSEPPLAVAGKPAIPDVAVSIPIVPATGTQRICSASHQIAYK